MIRRFSGTLEYKGTRRDYRVTEEDLEPYLDTLSSGARSRLLTTLARVRHGFDVDLVTPVIGKNTSDKLEARRFIRDATLKVVGQLDSSWQPLKDAETVQAEKVGPLSIMLPFSDRKPELLRYYSTSRKSVMRFFDGDALIKAYARIKSRLPRNLHPISLDEAFNMMPKNTNLGAPFYSKSSEYYGELMEMARAVEADRFDTKNWNDPCILYWRGQSTGLTTPVKQRGVWGYPHYITLHELRAQEALLPYLKALPEFCALQSNDAVNANVTSMLDKSRRFKFCMDFSSFDQTANHLLENFAFDLVRSCFKRSAKNLLDFIEDRFYNIPLIHPDGIWNGRHGVPSGSGWTNQIDSLINWLLAEYIAVKTNNNVEVLVQGDDAVWMFDGPMDLKTIQRYVSGFGMHVNVDKGGISKDVVLYLQNVHMTNHRTNGVSVGVRPLEKALSGICGFETPRDKKWRPVDTTIRWLQQLETTRYNPNFVILCKLVLSSDRILQDNNIREIVDIAGGMSELEARQKDRSFPFGKEPLRNIFQFASVNMIDELKRGGFTGDWWE